MRSIGISRVINRIIEKVIAFLGVFMSAVVALQVFCRYGLNHSLFWSEELARYMLVWLAFLGATVGFFRGVHPGVDLFSGRLKPVHMVFLSWFSHVTSLLLFIVLLVSGTRFAFFVRYQITPALGLPKWVIYSVIPVSAAVMIVHAISFMVELARGDRHDR